MIRSDSRTGRAAGAIALLLTVVLSAYPPGRAEAWWPERPGRYELRRSIKLDLDSVIVWSVSLPALDSANHAEGLTAIERTNPRTWSKQSRKWGLELMKTLFREKPSGRSCDCPLTRSREDTGEVVIAVVEYFLGDEVLWVPLSLRDSCAFIHLLQGAWGSLPIRRERGKVWSMLHVALASDEYFRSETPPAWTVGEPVSARPPAGDSDRYRLECPNATLRVAPTYPAAALEQNVYGTVLVKALVGKDGSVRETLLMWSIPALDQAATEAVRRWRFTPALRNGQPVAVWVLVPVRFRLY